jgi:CheY-like chemotaxis protein
VEEPLNQRNDPMESYVNPAPLAANANRAEAFDLSFKVFHELMARKINRILLVSSPYDAYIMEEEGRLAQRIIEEYRGLNLSRPPHLTWVSTAHEALTELERHPFDMVITMPLLGDMPAHALGRQIKTQHPKLPVILLTHNPNWMALDPMCFDRRHIDQVLIWSGNADLLLAVIKNVEDARNVAHDTQRAEVRVIVLVEDSPFYVSSLLPLLYKEIVTQTQAVIMAESLNEEHRFFRMRARPKILVARTFEEAQECICTYRPYLLAVLSDVRFPRGGRLDPDAGYTLLKWIKTEAPDLALLNFSSEESNRARAEQIPAVFLNKNSPLLHEEIRKFFQAYLGFGDFVFRLPDGQIVGRAANLRELENVLPEIPEASIRYHAEHNHFSGWLMARSEILMAYRLRPVKVSDFPSTMALKNYLVDCLKERRRGRQRGIVSDFDPAKFDPEADFVKVGSGSLGGKARGLAFIASRIKVLGDLDDRYPELAIGLPQSWVLSTEAFDAFIEENNLRDIASCERGDGFIDQVFQDGRMPAFAQNALSTIITDVLAPLAVRSSSLLEDAHHRPVSGLYQTHLLPNCHPDRNVRLRQLERAVKHIYASTYHAKARRCAASTGYRIEQEKMAVLVQRLTGSETDGYFYPALSGQAFSYNFYPVARMKPEEGIALISLGLGAPNAAQRRALRFSPAHPQLLPQFSTVDDILRNAPRQFRALNLKAARRLVDADVHPILEQLDIDDCQGHPAVLALSSCFLPDEKRIRDTAHTPPGGYRILTFAPLLKHNRPPLAPVVAELLAIGEEGMGGPVEIEFAIALPDQPDKPATFDLLQIRPMPQFGQEAERGITAAQKKAAVCYCRQALGNGHYDDTPDIVLVDPQRFDPSQTVAIAAEIGHLNAALRQADRRYLLIGPGRWGSSDRWLGIPVSWSDISQVRAIIETSHPQLQVDSSRGSHFFQNLTSAGIFYLTLRDAQDGFLRWDWLENQPVVQQTQFLRHICPPQTLVVQVDGRSSEAVIYEAAAAAAAEN